jgi:hypothetical protein
MTTGSAVLRRMASDSATDKASGLGTRKGNTSLRGSKDGILGQRMTSEKGSCRYGCEIET